MISLSMPIKFQANLKCQLVGQEDASKVLGLLATQSVFSSSIEVDLVSETLMITGGLSDSRYIPMHLIANSLLKQIHAIGFRTQPIAVTQYLKLNKVAELGPLMPMPLSHHCLVRINETTAIATGGFMSNNMATNNSFYYQISDSSQMIWTLGQSLILPRHSHSCGVLTSAKAVPIVVVAGGDTDNDDVSTELLVISCEKSDIAWEPGPSIPFKLEGTSMVATSNHDRLILIGGIMKSGRRSSALIQLKCLQSDNIDIAMKTACYWTLMDQKLTQSRLGQVDTVCK